MHFVQIILIDMQANIAYVPTMYIAVAILAFLLGGQVGKSLETMTPEKMQSIESKKNESIK